MYAGRPALFSVAPQPVMYPGQPAMYRGEPQKTSPVLILIIVIMILFLLSSIAVAMKVKIAVRIFAQIKKLFGKSLKDQTPCPEVLSLQKDDYILDIIDGTKTCPDDDVKTVIPASINKFSGTSGVPGSINIFSGTSGTPPTVTSGTSGVPGSINLFSGTSGTPPIVTSGTSGVPGSINLFSGTSGTPPTVTSGTPSTSGTSGTPSTSGTSGTSGVPGSINLFSGTSGTPSTSGPPGTPSTSGTSGTPSTSGTSGTPSTSGTSGQIGSVSLFSGIRSGTSGVTQTLSFTSSFNPTTGKLTIIGSSPVTTTYTVTITGGTISGTNTVTTSELSIGKDFTISSILPNTTYTVTLTSGTTVSRTTFTSPALTVNSYTVTATETTIILKGTPNYNVVFTAGTYGSVTTAELTSATGKVFTVSSLTPSAVITVPLLFGTVTVATGAATTPDLRVTNIVIVSTPTTINVKGTPNYNVTMNVGIQQGATLGTTTTTELISAAGKTFTGVSLLPNTQYTIWISYGSGSQITGTTTSPSLTVTGFTVTLTTTSLVVRGTSNYSVRFDVAVSSFGTVGTATQAELSAGKTIPVNYVFGETYEISLVYNGVIIVSVTRVVTDPTLVFGINNTASDISTLNNTLTITGSMTSPILYFDTTNAITTVTAKTEYCTIRRIEMYIMLNSLPDVGETQYLFTIGNAWEFMLSPTGSITFLINGSSSIIATQVSNLVKNRWYHIMVSYLNGTLTSYLDGAKIQQTNTSAPSTGTTVTCSPIIINNSDGGTRKRFNGWISNVRCYNIGYSPTSFIPPSAPSVIPTPVNPRLTGSIGIVGTLSSIRVTATVDQGQTYTVLLGTTVLGTCSKNELFAGKTFSGLSLPLSTTYTVSIVYNSITLGTASFTTPNSLGNFLWSRILDASGEDRILGTATDSSGNVYFTGFFSGTSPTYKDENRGNVVNLTATSGSGNAAFLTKYTSAGVHQWTKVLDGANIDRGLSVTCDSSGNVYFTGYYLGIGIFLSDNISLAASTQSSGFITKYTSAGVYQWSRIMESAGADQTLGVACDSDGNVYMSGVFNGTPLLKIESGVALTGVSFPASTTFAGFVTKLNTSGAHQWTRIFGNEINDVVCDAQRNVYTLGKYLSLTPMEILTQIGAPRTGVNLPIAQTTCGLLCKFDSSGTFQWNRIFSGGQNVVTGITCDSASNPYITGYYGVNEALTINPINITLPVNTSVANGVSAFITKFDSSGSHQWSQLINVSEAITGKIVCDSGNNVYITGGYRGVGTFRNQSGNPNGITFRTSTNSTTRNMFAWYTTKLSSSGAHQWSRIIDGNTAGSKYATAVSVDSTGVYITGSYSDASSLNIFSDTSVTPIKSLPVASVGTSAGLITKFTL